REKEIFQERDRKLEAARERRKLKRRSEILNLEGIDPRLNNQKNSGLNVLNQLTYAQQYSNSG
ncbi:MAG TPA: hypothetical protein ENI81_11775, partial [Phycisphaerales bacterium]|nr:hypothetical protein [Phycisphaerales bacterium]